MLVTEDKVLIHFNTNDISVYVLKENTLKLLNTELVTFEDEKKAPISFMQPVQAS